MSDTVRKVDYFYVVVPDRPGECSKVLSALAAENINLLAFSGFPSSRKGQLDLVPEDSAAFKVAAKKLKLKLSPRKSGFLLQGDDRVGAMNEILGKLDHDRHRTAVALASLPEQIRGYGHVKQAHLDKVAKRQEEHHLLHHLRSDKQNHGSVNVF